MRILAMSVLAAVGLAVAMPAYADNVSVGVGGVGVHEHDRDVGEHRVIREHRRVTVGLGEHRSHCKIVIVHREGMTKKIKRCY